MKKLFVLNCFLIILGVSFAFGPLCAQQATGNNGPAQRLSDQAKKEMVEKNAPDTKKKEQYAQKEGLLMLPGFVPSGDKAIDMKNYQTAKSAWIQANPAEYRAAMKKDPAKRSGAQTVTASPVTNHGF